MTVRVVPLEEFIAIEEADAEPLLGIRRENLLPAGGRLLMYGDGGAGKTTFTIDAVGHLASGVRWLEIEVPRPLRFLVIENEGSRGMFREKLGEKVLDWRGPPFRHNVFVLEDPWAQFTFGDATVTEPVASFIDANEIDVLIAGPLASLGTIGGGTPAEVEAFVKLLDEVKRSVDRSYAEWLIHHENKAGAISGAWNRVPDTLVHVSGQGNGRTRVRWEKCRHASTWHDTVTNLVWTDGKSFTVEGTKVRDLLAELLEAFADDDQWRTAKECAELVHANIDKVRTALSSLVERGEMLTKEARKDATRRRSAGASEVTQTR